MVLNQTRNSRLGERVELAESSQARRTGLLGHERLLRGEGLWIVPCEAVHTFFMKFPIDVLYLNRDQTVRKTVRALAPWRVSGSLPAYSTLELPAGTIDETNTEPGDQLVFQPC